MPVELKRKKSSNSAKRKSTFASAQDKPTSKALLDNTGKGDADALLEPIRYLGGKHRTSRQRAKYHQLFEELTTVMEASNPSLRSFGNVEAYSTTAVAGISTAAAATATSSSSSPLIVPIENAFPTLSVGYLARAMGLNVSNAQIASIIELIEEDGPSTGFVDKRKLESVLVDALLTGTIGGPTLRDSAAAAAASNGEDNAGKLSLERLERFTPSVCFHDDEATLFRAFQALDVEQKGYLEQSDLTPMMTKGEKFSTEEADEMWMAMRDPETDRIYYSDFADVLARE
jgi:Ca2+-binding EF-hand superfamily protein